MMDYNKEAHWLIDHEADVNLETYLRQFAAKVIREARQEFRGRYLMDARTLAEQLKDIHEKMTPGPWESRKERQLKYSQDDGKTFVTDDIPAHIVWRRRDEENNRVTSFVANCNGHGCNNDADAAGISAVRNLLPDIISALQSQWVTITDDPGTLQTGDLLLVTGISSMDSDTRYYMSGIYVGDGDIRDAFGNVVRPTHYQKITRLPAPPKADSSGKE